MLLDSKVSKIIISLLKNVIYQDAQPELWHDLLTSQAVVRDYIAVIGLSLFIDEAEGYAFLQQKKLEENEAEEVLPRLIARRPLSYNMSLLCVLLRKKLLEQDAAGGATRVILSHEQIVDMMKVFSTNQSNEVKIHEQISVCINKMLDIGFLRRLKTDERRYELGRIIKAFVNGDWLANIEQKISEYQDYGSSKSKHV